MKAVADAFAAVADGVESNEPLEELRPRFHKARAACREASASAVTDLRHMLNNVQQALVAWEDVWPRLGSQAPFRQAVIREARAWAKQFGR